MTKCTEFWAAFQKSLAEDEGFTMQRMLDDKYPQDNGIHSVYDYDYAEKEFPNILANWLSGRIINAMAFSDAIDPNRLIIS